MPLWCMGWSAGLARSIRAVCLTHMRVHTGDRRTDPRAVREPPWCMWDENRRTTSPVCHVMHPQAHRVKLSMPAFDASFRHHCNTYIVGFLSPQYLSRFHADCPRGTHPTLDTVELDRVMSRVERQYSMVACIIGQSAQTAQHAKLKRSLEAHADRLGIGNTFQYTTL